MNWNRIKSRHAPQTLGEAVVLVLTVVSLFVVVVLPMAAIVFYSFVNRFPVMGNFGFTLRHYRELATSTDLLIEITVNTAIYAGGTMIVALVLGFALAVIIGKYFQQSYVRFLLILPYGLPSIAALTGWITLLGNNGILTNLIMTVFGLSKPPFDIFSIWGMIFVEGLHVAPIAYLLIMPSLQSIPKAMEESSYVTGASWLYTLRKVIIPVVRPAILSTAIFIFVRTTATVGTPGVLGVPAREYTFGSVIPFLFLSGGTLNYSKALAFSVFMTSLSAVFVIYYMRVTAEQDKYTTVTGTGEVTPLSYSTGTGGKVVLMGIVVGYILFAGILPFFAVIFDSLNPTYQYTYVLSELSVEHYVSLLTNNMQNVTSVPRVFGNTLLLAFTVPTTTMILTLLIAYTNQSLDMTFGATFSFIAAFALGLPGIAKGLGFLVALIQTPLYGTIGILFVALHGHSVPYGMRYSSPALTKLGKENFEAAITTGDDIVNTFKNIALPLVSDEFIAGWTHVYMFVIRNISITVLLYTTGSEVLSIALLKSLTSGYFKEASTLAVAITVITMIPYMVIQYARMKREGQVVGIAG